MGLFFDAVRGSTISILTTFILTAGHFFTSETVRLIHLFWLALIVAFLMNSLTTQKNVITCRSNVEVSIPFVGIESEFRFRTIYRVQLLYQPNKDAPQVRVVHFFFALAKRAY